MHSLSLKWEDLRMRRCVEMDMGEHKLVLSIEMRIGMERCLVMVGREVSIGPGPWWGSGWVESCPGPGS